MTSPPELDTDMLLTKWSSKSSVSLNTLLSSYLTELQQLAEGSLLAQDAQGPGEDKEVCTQLLTHNYACLRR
jgi:hypothetical protein